MNEKPVAILINRKAKMSRQNVQKIRYTYAIEIGEVEVENGNQFCKEI